MVREDTIQQGRARQGMAGLGQALHDSASEGRAEQDRAGQSRTIQRLYNRILIYLTILADTGFPSSYLIKLMM